MRQPAASITICSLLGPSAHHGLTVEKKSSKTKLSAQAGLLPAKNELTNDPNDANLKLPQEVLIFMTLFSEKASNCLT